MSRIYLGIGILLLLLALCIVFSLWVPRTHMAISRQLEQAVRFAQQDDWLQASRFVQQAAQSWKQAHDLTTMVADHEPADEIDSLFAQLEVYAAQQDAVGFGATAAQLSSLTAALGNSQSFSLWNLL